MNRFPSLIFAILWLFSAVAASAAPPTDYPKRSDEILAQLRELDLLNQILPVLLTKDQIGKLLPVVEKARSVVKETEKAEYEQLAKLSDKIQPAIKDAYAKGKVPSQELLLDYAKTFAKLQVVRRSVVEANTTTVLEAAKKIMDKGQIAAAKNALNPALFDPTLKLDQMDDDAKLRFWVKVILLDPATYGILNKLAK